VTKLTRRRYLRLEMAASRSDGGTFVFANIAGYAALTEAHGDADAADLAATFCMASRTCVCR
jgi:class 3 adenylate cyclase